MSTHVLQILTQALAFKERLGGRCCLLSLPLLLSSVYHLLNGGFTPTLTQIRVSPIQVSVPCQLSLISVCVGRDAPSRLESDGISEKRVLATISHNQKCVRGPRVVIRESSRCAISSAKWSHAYLRRVQRCSSCVVLLFSGLQSWPKGLFSSPLMM